MTAPEGGGGTTSTALAACIPSINNHDTNGAHRSSGLRGLQLPGQGLRVLLRSLTPTDRLHVFKTSRGLAAAVLQHADWGHEAQVVDTLFQAGQVQVQGKQQVRSDQAAPGKVTYRVTLTLDAQWEQGVSQQQLQARCCTLQGVLSTAPGASLRVVLRHGITSMWARLPTCQVTRLSLVDLHLPAGLATMLPLQQCSKLCTLCLDNVQWDQQQGFNLTTLSEQQRAAFLAPALDHLEVQGLQAWGGLNAWAQLLGKQIKHLSTKLVMAPHPNAVQPIPASLLALTHFHTGKRVTDQLLDDLAALPSLTHVTAGGMDLSNSHLSKELQWQQLSVAGDLAGLKHIKLQAIKCIVLRGYIGPYKYEDAEELDRLLLSHPCVQCQPVSPECSFTLYRRYTAQLAFVCARRLTCQRVCLALLHHKQLPTELPAAIHNLPPLVTCLALNVKVDFQTELRSAIHSLPSHVTCLALHYPPSGYNQPAAELPEEDLKQEEQFMQQVARELPPHVNRIWLRTPGHVCRGLAWASAVLSALATSQRHLEVLVGGNPVSNLPAHLQDPIDQLVKVHPTLLSFRLGQDQ